MNLPAYRVLLLVLCLCVATLYCVHVPDGAKDQTKQQLGIESQMLRKTKPRIDVSELRDQRNSKCVPCPPGKSPKAKIAQSNNMADTHT